MNKSISPSLSKSPAQMRQPAPMIGQHNREVLIDLLGLSHSEVREGYEDGTLWPPEMPIYPYMQEEALR